MSYIITFYFNVISNPGISSTVRLLPHTSVSVLSVTHSKMKLQKTIHHIIVQIIFMIDDLITLSINIQSFTDNVFERTF